MTFVFFRSVAKTKSFCRIPKRLIYVLGIESSCDDTSAAILNDSGSVLGEGHFSQARVHLEAGGIIPSLAYNLHKQYLKSVVDTSVKESMLNFKDLNAIAVTVKPGLIMSLQAGVEYAKDLCTLYSKPLIPIHHMEAHALTARMTEDVKFPFLVFLLSGGHCILALVKSVNKFYTLGGALDQAPGNALDKIARRAKIKNLNKFRGMVGGVAIETAALQGDASVFRFEPYILHSQGRNCNFSYSGMVKAALNHIQQEEKKHGLGPDEVIPNINDLCAGVLLCMSRHLCQRLEIAFHYLNMRGLLTDVEKCLVMSGGVACNNFIREAVRKVCDEYEYKMVVPSSKLCTDNGLMIAWNGIEILRENLPIVQPDNLSSVAPLAKCPLGEDISNDVKEMGKQMTFKFMKLGATDTNKSFLLSEILTNRMCLLKLFNIFQIKKSGRKLTTYITQSRRMNLSEKQTSETATKEQQKLGLTRNAGRPQQTEIE